MIIPTSTRLPKELLDLIDKECIRLDQSRSAVMVSRLMASFGCKEAVREAANDEEENSLQEQVAYLQKLVEDHEESIKAIIATLKEQGLHVF